MKPIILPAALLAALVLAGCTAPKPASGDYKGTLVNHKLKQDTAAQIAVQGALATVTLPNLTENGQPCRAVFVPADSKVSGTAVYKGDFAGAIGACRIFAQEPGTERFLLLRNVGSGIEAVFSRDELGRNVLISGTVQ